MATVGAQSTLVEIKAIDDAYPLFGSLILEGDASLEQALTQADGIHGVAVDPLLLGRLGLKSGTTLRLGSAEMYVGGVIASEPDRIADGFVLGPRILLSPEALATTGLVQPGSLVTWRYRVKLPDGSNLKLSKAIVKEANKQFPTLAGACAPPTMRLVEPSALSNAWATS